MNTEKNMSTRIIHKHDIEANWNKAINFIPKQGELIVYDPDENCSYQRIKIGDGTTKINDLNFTKTPGYVAQPEAPYDTSLFWLDTNDDGSDGMPGSGGTGSVMGGADWNASEDEPGHVLNRTHWVEGDIVEIIPETTLTTTEDSPGQFTVPDGVFVIEAGKTYIVTYNGTEYTCVAVDSAVIVPDEPGMAIIGNYSAMLGTGDTGEPFIAFYMPGYGSQIIDVTGAMSITVAVSCNDVTVHKLPMEFLPDGYPYIETVSADPTFDGDLTGRESMDVSDVFGSEAYIVKISSQYVGIADMSAARIAFHTNDMDLEQNLVEDSVIDASDALGASGTLVLLDNTMVVLSLPQDSEIMGATVSAGTWFAYVPGYFYVKSLSCLMPVEVEVVHKLDNKFIDAEWMAKSEIINIDPTISGSGSIVGREKIILSNGQTYVKVTDQYVTTPEIINSTACYVVNGIRKEGTVTADWLIDLTDTFGALGTGILCGSQAIFTVPDSTTIDVLGITFTKGTWFSYESNENYVESLSCLFAGSKEVAHVIPKKFLPDMLPEVNSSNEGAFLRVVNGAWALDTLANVEDGEF